MTSINTNRQTMMTIKGMTTTVAQYLGHFKINTDELENLSNCQGQT